MSKIHVPTCNTECFDEWDLAKIISVQDVIFKKEGKDNGGYPWWAGHDALELECICKEGLRLSRRFSSYPQNLKFHSPTSGILAYILKKSP